MSYSAKLTPILIIASALCLTACGGSGNSYSRPSYSNGGGVSSGQGSGSEPQWQAGQYLSSASLKNYCASPRTGVDPYSSTGANYPDKQGSANYEKLWLRSWSNETYLWYDELNDINPAGYGVQQYFDKLKTDAVTDSGATKDHFHFYIKTADYKQETQVGVVAGYGIEWHIGSATPPRSLTVAYVDADSPAARAGITRGAKLAEIDGVDVVNDSTQAGVDTINGALFSATPGDIHTLRLINQPGGPDDKSYQLTAANVETSPVRNVKVLDTAAGKVGYLQFNSHVALAQDKLIDAVNQFNKAGISELVLDMRYNGGGLLAIASQLSYMIAGPANIQEQFFDQTVRNDKMSADKPTPFYANRIDYDQGKLTTQTLPNLHLNRVFVLSTDQTCSASEAVINGLRGIGFDVILIGGKTCGKPYGFVPEDNCGTTYFTIQFKGQNAAGFGDYPDGFTPTETPQFGADVQGCLVDDDFTKALGDPNEGQLHSALYYMSNGHCPAQAKHKPYSNSSAAKPGLAIRKQDPRIKAFLLENQINQPIYNPAGEQK